MSFDYFTFLRGLLPILDNRRSENGPTDPTYVTLLKLVKDFADQMASMDRDENSLRHLVDTILDFGSQVSGDLGLRELLRQSTPSTPKGLTSGGTGQRRGAAPSGDTFGAPPPRNFEEPQTGDTNMAIETAKEINSLIDSWPLSGESSSEPRTKAPARQIQVTARSMSGEPTTEFEPQTRYDLRFFVATPSSGSLAEGNVDVTDVPKAGLQARWIVTSTDVEFLSVSPRGIVEKQGDTWACDFPLEIPGDGESEVVSLNVRTTEVTGNLMVRILVAGEEYRKLDVKLGFGAKVIEDAVCTAPGHIRLRPTHEWTTPPEHLAFYIGARDTHISTIRGANEYGSAEWTAKIATLKNPIDNVRKALEKFRIAAETHVNSLDVTDMLSRLKQERWKPYDWGACATVNVACPSDSAYTKALHDLAHVGYTLFDTCFPPDSRLRAILESLPPGSRTDFIWTSRGAVDWVSHVPWALMYMKSVEPFESVDCSQFFGLHFRIGSTSYESNQPSKALGDPAQVSALHFLYWGSNPNDDIGAQSSWQRNEFKSWARHHLVPNDPKSQDRKSQVILALANPGPRPAGILYFYCQCSVKDGSEPILQFGEDARIEDTVEEKEFGQKVLTDAPFIFANACTTASSVALGASELEASFFRRDVRAFLGTESRVPVVLASRFAWLFFQFFLRRVDPKPMAAGEALAQSRMFLWSQYGNLGGLFYCLVNRYDLFLASADEVKQLKESTNE
ncbi:hypothetical protein WN982_40145 [Paraburkholderia sp. IMGN_8]|uniref:hypothetical protein n=1 Tax=Paraburkholderia sp. IMGN_8 TaxID=3136564 RepID=UPI0031013C0C